MVMVLVNNEPLQYIVMEAVPVNGETLHLNEPFTLQYVVTETVPTNVESLVLHMRELFRCCTSSQSQRRCP